MDMFSAVLAAVSVLIVAAVWLSVRAGRRRSSTTCPQGTEVRKPRVILTHHALARMNERAVTNSQINLVVQAPDRQTPDAVKSSVRLERDLGGKTLIVWIAQPAPTAGQVVVKSTAWRDQTLTFTVPAKDVRVVVGRGGTTIKRLEREHRVRIGLDRSGAVKVSAVELGAAEAARSEIRSIIAEGAPRETPPINSRIAA